MYFIALKVNTIYGYRNKHMELSFHTATPNVHKNIFLNCVINISHTKYNIIVVLSTYDMVYDKSVSNTI